MVKPTIDILEPKCCNTPTEEIKGTIMVRKCKICGKFIPSKIVEVKK